MKYEVVYIGMSARMVQELLHSTLYHVAGIITDGKRVSEGFFEAIPKDLPCYIVNDKQELELTIRKTQVDCMLMYEFGIIIPETIIQEYRIFNFHPGSLRDNRGASPINWSVLLGEKETCFSLYQISEKIDLGLLISERICSIDTDLDTPLRLKNKLEMLIPDLLMDLKDFLDGKLISNPITEGIYRKRIVESDYTIDPEKDSFESIKNKIRSQAEYYGAILWVGNEKKYVDKVERQGQDLVFHFQEVP